MKTFKNLKEQIIVVTGASSGIGREVARLASESEATVYGISRTAGDISAVKYLLADVSKKEEVDAAFEKIISENGRIDILINNAGMGIGGAVENATQEDINKIISVNLIGTSNCMRAVLACMRNARYGKIINISSVAGVMPIPFQAFYSATKSAIRLLSESTRMEVKPFGVQVGIILPGDIRTAFTKNRIKNILESPYKENETKSILAMERDEQNGMSPEYAARCILKYASKRKLPVSLVIGFKYKIFMILEKFLPRRFILFVISKLY